MKIPSADPEQNIKVHICNNCGHELTVTAQYCPVCGQKPTTGKVPLKSFLSEFIATTLNLDSSFFRTLSHLFIPAYLTKEFFKGRHVAFYRPLRLFFVTLVLLYAVLGAKYFSRIELGLESDNERLDYFISKQIDEKLPDVKRMICYDTLPVQQQALIDSFTRGLQKNREYDFLLNLNISQDSSEKISIADVYEMETDSLFRKYGIEGFIPKLMTLQLIQVRKDPEGAIQSFIANTSWMLLLIMPALALVMKLLYIRRKKYYVEHLVFLFHYHAAVFSALIVYFLLISYLPVWLLITVPTLCVLFLLLAMKRYYQQHIIKTTVKFLILIFTYQILLILFMLLTVTVSFFIL